MRRGISRGRGRRSAVVGAGLLAAAFSTTALAGPEAQTDQQLEQRIAELEAQLESVVSQMRAGATTELAARVAELESVALADDGLNAYWKNGIRLDSADKQFKFKFGGRIMNDYAYFDADQAVETALGEDLESGVEFRRARLYFAGEIYQNVAFKAQYDFAGGDADFKDMYIKLKKSCLFGADVTVGNAHVPFGLEEITSSKYITFMERGLAAGFAPSRKNGIKLNGKASDGQVLWAVGAYRESNAYGDDRGNTGQGEWNLAGRVSGVVAEDEEQDMTLALGASAALTNPDNDDQRLRSRGGQHLSSSRFVDTGTFATDDEGTLLGLDAALVMGQFHAMAEWARAEYDLAGGGEATFDGLTLQAGVFLTGETRNFKASKGNFDRTKPSVNYGDEDGRGAWEAAIRYDEIDLNDGTIAGGEMDQITVGLNWYLNPNTRWMVNYVMADIDRVGDVDIFEMRFQIDF